jgi:hypothetical protein
MADIRHEQHDWGDIYEGSQAALIQAGVAKPELFPVEPQFDKWGRTRRTFHFESCGRSGSLYQRGTGDYWQVRIYLNDGERRERTAAKNQAAAPKASAAKRDSLEQLRRKVEATAAACMLAADGLARLIAGASQNAGRCMSLIESNLGAARAIADGALNEMRQQK